MDLVRSLEKIDTNTEENTEPNTFELSQQKIDTKLVNVFFDSGQY